jgi:hypothetical protein
VTHIQSQLGRRPILAAGNSAGDREMPITTVASRLGWTVISMARDWSRVFPA